MIVLTTTTLYKIVQSELYALGHDHEIVDKEGNLVFFDNKFQVMSKIMSYDEDIKKIINHLFNGYGLEKSEHDTHFKKMFFYRFINREINRQTVESFMFELMSTFMMNQDHINRVYNDLEKYILQHATSDTSNKQLSKEISQQINQQVSTQLDERLNSETSTSGNTQNTTDESTGNTSSTSNQDTKQDTTQSVNGNTTSDNRQARSDLPQNRVNLDVNNTLMATANENDISRNKQTNNQDTDSNVTGNTKDTSSGTSENHSTSNVTGSTDAESNGESTGRTENDSHGQTDGTSDSESTGESSTLNMIYQLDELFKSSSVMEHIMNEFDKKCFLQFW